jgi:hypothetical protein
MNDKPRVEMQDIIKFWDNFNYDLYIKICIIKSQIN